MRPPIPIPIPTLALRPSDPLTNRPTSLALALAPPPRPPDSASVVAAALIPRLDLFISLIGALASSCLAIIFPAIIETCTFWVRERNDSPQESGHEASKRRRHDWPHTWLVLKNSLLLVFGLLGLATGSWQSLSQLFASDLLEARPSLKSAQLE